MDRPNVIQVGGAAPAWLAPALQIPHGIECHRGVVVVEMDEPRCKQGSIYLPDEAKGRYRADSGTVLAACETTGLMQGERVLVSPYDGKWLSGFRSGGYQSNGEVRIFGRQVLVGESASIYPWARSVRAVTREIEQGVRISPTATNVLIRRQALQETMHGIQLTDDERYREPIAEVVAVGPDCDPIVQPGDRWVYLNGACKKSFLADIEFGSEFEKDLALIDEAGLLCRVT